MEKLFLSSNCCQYQLYSKITVNAMYTSRQTRGCSSCLQQNAIQDSARPPGYIGIVNSHTADYSVNRADWLTCTCQKHPKRPHSLGWLSSAQYSIKPHRDTYTVGCSVQCCTEYFYKVFQLQITNYITLNYFYFNYFADEAKTQNDFC